MRFCQRSAERGASVDSRDREDGASAALARVDALHTGPDPDRARGRRPGPDRRGGGPGPRRRACWSRRPTAGSGPPHLGDEHRELLREHDLVDPTGRLRVERVSDGGTAVGAGEMRSCGSPPAEPTWPGWSAFRAGSPISRRRRARARAGGRGRGAADHPRGGGHGGREQVPGRLPARPLPAPGRRRAVRRRARRRVRLGPALARSSCVAAEIDPPAADADPVSGRAAAAVAGAVLGGLAAGHRRPSAPASRAWTSPPRWSPCCRSPTATTSRWRATTSYAGWSPRWPATRAAAGGRSRSASAGWPARSTSCPTPTGRPGGRSRSAAA